MAIKHANVNNEFASTLLFIIFHQVQKNWIV